MNDDLMTVFAYIKGVAEPNPGTAAWGGVMRYKDTTKEFGGRFSEPMSNVRAEIEAVMYTLDNLTRSCVIVIHTNLQFLPAKMQSGDWLYEKNLEMYDALNEYSKIHTLHWQWLRKGENQWMNHANEIALGYLRRKD